MYVVQHFDELHLSQEKKMNVIKYAKLSVPAVNQSIRSITIKYSQANPGLGRFTTRGPSLQTVPRTVRHTISAAFYYDIDTVNCAPTLLSQYCIKHDIPTPALASYVLQWQERLTDLVKATVGYPMFETFRIMSHSVYGVAGSSRFIEHVLHCLFQGQGIS
jgi:hypothetical protein